MKSTGVVRQVDKLGRIVIPKEIRRILKIRDNDNLEIFVNNETILLKKYSLFNSFKNIIYSVPDIVYEITKKNIIITDMVQVIGCNNKIKGKYLNKNILDSYLDLLKRREKLISNELVNLNVVDEKEIKKNYLLNPIIVNGEIIGSIIFFSNEEKIGIEDKYLLDFILQYLEKNIED